MNLETSDILTYHYRGYFKFLSLSLCVVVIMFLDINMWDKLNNF